MRITKKQRVAITTWEIFDRAVEINNLNYRTYTDYHRRIFLGNRRAIDVWSTGKVLKSWGVETVAQTIGELQEVITEGMRPRVSEQRRVLNYEERMAVRQKGMDLLKQILINY
jgi:hypothetical protein